MAFISFSLHESSPKISTSRLFHGKNPKLFNIFFQHTIKRHIYAVAWKLQKVKA